MITVERPQDSTVPPYTPLSPSPLSPQSPVITGARAQDPTVPPYTAFSPSPASPPSPVISDERAQELIDHALETGYVEQRDVVAVITGLMGSGKTWLLSRLFHELPPDLYTSTGISEKSLRGLLNHIGCMSTDSWKRLFDNHIREFLAYVFRSGTSEIDVASLATNLITSNTDASPLPSPPSLDVPLDTLAEESPTSQKLVRLVKKATGSINQFMLEIVHMIDTGGQPEYMEVMPCLIHNANLAVLVLNLMYSLDDHVPMNFHEKGIAYRRQTSSQYTSRQIIRMLVSTLKSRRSSHKIFRMLVVATHRDCIKGDVRARVDALNRELCNLLLPTCEKELILSSSPDKVAFVLNLKDPDSNDEKALKLIRKSVSNSDLGLVLKVPGSFFMYEQDLLEFAVSVGRHTLSLAECLQVGDRLKMSDEVVQAALVFFHHQNTFLYFQRALPNLVFVTPQVPLDFVNAIVRFSYKAIDGHLKGFPAKFVSSLKNAIITEEMLSHKELSSCFVPGLYEPHHAIKLFLHTFTLAPLNSHQQQPTTSKRKAPQLYSRTPDDKEYLMMCLLPAIPDLKLQQYIPSSVNVEPLVLKFTDDCVPLGCFGCTISCLLSVFQWKVNRKGDGTPECLAHNIVSLCDPNLPVKIVLVDATQHITVYIDAEEDICELYPYICCQVHKTLFSALVKVFDIMKLTEIEISPAVLCPCKASPEAHSACHYKVKTTHFLRCSKTNATVGKAQDKHVMWLGLTEESQPRNEIQSSKYMYMYNMLGNNTEFFLTKFLQASKAVSKHMKVEMIHHTVLLHKLVMDLLAVSKHLQLPAFPSAVVYY